MQPLQIKLFVYLPIGTVHMMALVNKLFSRCNKKDTSLARSNAQRNLCSMQFYVFYCGFQFLKSVTLFLCADCVRNIDHYVKWTTRQNMGTSRPAKSMHIQGWNVS